MATIKSRLRSVVSNWLRLLSNSCVGYSLSEAIILASITVAIRLLIIKEASGDRKLKFDQLYCELLANNVLLLSIILLAHEEALWPKKLEISHASQILTNKHQILVLS